MNNLKLTNNVNIGFKNGRHLGRRLSDCIMVDYLEINEFLILKSSGSVIILYLS